MNWNVILLFCNFFKLQVIFSHISSENDTQTTSTADVVDVELMDHSTTTESQQTTLNQDELNDFNTIVRGMSPTVFYNF